MESTFKKSVRLVTQTKDKSKSIRSNWKCLNIKTTMSTHLFFNCFSRLNNNNNDQHHQTHLTCEKLDKTTGT